MKISEKIFGINYNELELQNKFEIVEKYEDMNGKNIETSNAILVLEKSKYQSLLKIESQYFEVIYIKLLSPKKKAISKNSDLPF